ncbi:hypothetical protein EOD39_18813 [Acipenser ruthenus]|uniref:ZMYM2-like/QRICH1 C-terminal domain-containing protein n=1 Tax=Acipenser ruthenus TaxID=7906 RepID=A0A444UZV8_ACIRT|nr:hypothetical protein EOD39_18813 [Acipenser ruthenus]
MNWHLGVTLVDLSNLVTWAHSHGTICRQTPGHQGALQLSPRGECTVMWLCAAGHAYNWPFTPLLPVSTASNPWGEEEGQEGGQPSGRKRKRSKQKHSRRSKLSLCEEATNVSSDLSDCSLLTQASTENRNEHDSCNGTAGDLSVEEGEPGEEIQPKTEAPSEELDSHLAAFFGAVRRPNGADFSANSLVFFHRGVERYLRSEGYGLSLTKSPEFSGSREALRSRFRELWRREKERETTAIEGLGFEEEEELRLKGVLSRLSPEGLLTLVLLNNTRAFGRAHLTQSWPVSWGEFRLVREAGVGDGGEGVTEYLEWRDFRGSEPHLRLYSTPENPERCPLQDFKEYVRRRSGGYLSPQDPLYVSCKPLNSAWEDTWYCRKALPKSKMEKMVKVLSQQVLAIRKKNGINSTGI